MNLFSILTWQQAICDPWTLDPQGTGWIVASGVLVGLSCGWIGTFLVLRRMSMVGDAVSHSVLPGLALAFLWSQSRALWVMIPGAFIAGWLTTFLIDVVQRWSRIKGDAALGIVFSVLFAFGVVLITVYADNIDLDAECVLYGEVGYVGFMLPVTVFGVETFPDVLWQLVIVTAICGGFVLMFFKELVLLCFDPMAANGQGIAVRVLHYAMMGVVALVIVGSFQAVGAILVVAMLIFPAATALLWFKRIPAILLSVVPLALLYAFGGFHLAVALDSSIAACMVIVACVVFCVNWVAYLLVTRLVFRAVPAE
jgi:manganese/zinc/iron transport system permease protein